MPNKISVFISHAGPDAELARAWQSLLRGISANTIDVWCSTDQKPGGGIDLGHEWYPQLVRELRQSSYLLAIVSPYSIGRPWVNWECGAASVSDGKHRVVVVKEPGVDLPRSHPLNQLNAYEANDERTVRSLCDRLLTDIGISELLKQLPSETRPNINSLVEEFLCETKEIRERRLEDLVYRELSEELSNADLVQGEGLGLCVASDVGMSHYTNLIAKLLDILERSAQPRCQIYNFLQPRDYLEEFIDYLLRAKDDEGLELLTEFRDSDLKKLGNNKAKEVRCLVDRYRRNVFPSIVAIDEFASRNPSSCKRYTVLLNSRSTDVASELWFLNVLMRTAQDHFIFKEHDAVLAVEPRAMRKSDFSLWRNDDLLVVTDFYPESQSLIVHWASTTASRPNFMSSLVQLIQTLDRWHGKQAIDEYLVEKLHVSRDLVGT